MKIRIAEVRNQKGVSQRELAARVGATMSMLGKLERGERQMTFRWLQRIGEALGVPTGELLDASGEPVHVGTVLADGTIDVDNHAPPNPEVGDDQTVPVFDIPSASFSNRCAVVLHDNMSVQMPADARFIYTLPMQRADRELVGRLSVIWAGYENTPDKRGQFLGYILPGASKGRFHVMPLNGRLVEDVIVGQIALISEIDIPQRTDSA
ncbi:helix-turn-helix domain-containing protein [Sphingomonas sp. ac-8]|uniref:helix-turn-helix domain-containing protein n=1 Tax=Sphingomonas sp. ac-8 TaxID=3242977 RepID=UPI003A807D70